MAVTPLMKQYLKTKDEIGSDTILLYRVGDFYETFYDDAKRASSILGITLTSRNKEAGNNIPLAGFPVHAIDKYMTKLVESGFKVAIAEQTEDPKMTKQLVKRDVVEIITPGTTLNDNLIDDNSYNFLAAIYFVNNEIYVAYIDITTAVLFVDKTDKISEYILKLSPSEIVISEEYKNKPELLKLRSLLPSKIVFTYYHSYLFYEDTALESVKTYFNVNSLACFGIEENDISVVPVNVILSYLKDTKKGKKRFVNRIEKIKNENFLEIDYSSIRNLELIEPLHSDDKKATLFSVIKRTVTPMGTRFLKNIIKKPLVDKLEIDKRLDIVDYFYNNNASRIKLRNLLKNINDLERLVGKLVYNRVNARDLMGLYKSLSVIPEIVREIENVSDKNIHGLIKNIYDLTSVTDLIERSIKEDAPITVREGKLLKKGYNSDLDEILDIVENSNEWIKNFENSERKRTNIPKLKVKYNKVFGYFVEVTKSFVGRVPDNYIRKQTLVNCERYITEELKSKEELILNSRDKVNGLQYSLFMEIVEFVKSYADKIQETGDAIAMIDNYLAFAQLALENGYVKPRINNSDKIIIKSGRHPVIEKLVLDEDFISNDIYLDNNKNQIMIITGPNMAGKSTYLRQIALISIMAQIGSFVSAGDAEICVADKIFTRIGAYDRLSKGQSTFLVEMTEVANILHNATDRSLVLLDEVGRGTSTFDGLSLAWSIVEYLATEEGKKPKTVFATHYHELIDLAEIYDGVVNYNVSIKRDGERLIFLRKIQEGGVSDSYGIDVAKLAGVPDVVVGRARNILKKVEKFEINLVGKKIAKEKRNDEVSELFDSSKILKDGFISKFKKINLDNLTPIEALNLLYNLKNDVKKI